MLPYKTFLTLDGEAIIMVIATDASNDALVFHERRKLKKKKKFHKRSD